MKRRIFACLILAALLTGGPAFAQVAFNTGSIYGKVFGNDGQPLPGVTVTLESQGMAGRTAFTGDGGAYRFSGLVPGPYAVSFSIQGFAEVRQKVAAHLKKRNIKPLTDEELDQAIDDAATRGATEDYLRTLQ